MQSKKILYLFDFDGTLTHCDSLFDFMRFVSSPTAYYLKFLFFLPHFLLAILGISKNEQIKERFIASFLKGKSEDELAILAKKYSQTIEKIIRPKALKYLQKIKKEEHATVYIVSASMDIWLKPIAQKLNLKLICTQALYQNGIYTGKFASPNCNFNEKKKRILQEINPNEYKKIIAFGDSNGDLALFSIANETHFKPFQ